MRHSGNPLSELNDVGQLHSWPVHVMCDVKSRYQWHEGSNVEVPVQLPLSTDLPPLRRCITGHGL
jgi:hypothetical protein